MIEQENGINTKPASSGNPCANATIEQIHQVLGNLVITYNLQETHVDDSDPWMGILAAADFAVRITYRRALKQIWANLFWPIHDTPNQ